MSGSSGQQDQPSKLDEAPPEEDSEYVSTYFDELHDFIFARTQEIAAAVNVFCDFLILYSLYNSGEYLKNRTGILLFHIAIYDLLYVSVTPQFWLIFFYLNSSKIWARLCSCVLLQTNNFIEICKCVLIFLMLSDGFIDSNQFTNGAMILIVNVFLISLFVIGITLCTLRVLQPRDLKLGTIVFTFLFLVTLAKEISMYYETISDDALLRLNVARVTVYNWVCCFVIDAVFVYLWGFSGYRVASWLSLSLYLNGFYLFLYLYQVDDVFKISIQDIFGNAGEILKNEL